MPPAVDFGAPSANAKRSSPKTGRAFFYSKNMIICYNQTEKQKVIWGKNWYGCSKEYLSPGEKVSDPNNYGNGYWLYIFKTEFGDLLKIGKES